MRKKDKLETFIQCPDPKIAITLKQGDKVRVQRNFRGEEITIDFIVRYYQQEDSYNGNWLVSAFTQELNKLLGKPKSYIHNELLVMNIDNISRFSFCQASYKRWNMSKVRTRNIDHLNSVN